MIYETNKNRSYIEEPEGFSCTVPLSSLISFFTRAQEKPIPSPISLGSFKFEEIPREILDPIIKSIGPSILMLASICTKCKEIFENHENLLKYRQAIGFLNESQQIRLKVNSLWNWYFIYSFEKKQIKKIPHDIIKALALVDPMRALRLTDSMYVQNGLNLSEDVNIPIPAKCKVLIPAIKTLGLFDPQKMLNTAYKALENIQNCCPYQASKAIASLAKTLRPIHPERTLEMINGAIKAFENGKYFPKVLVHLLPILALFDVELALKKLPYAQPHNIDRTIIAIATELAVENPEKALAILNNAFSKSPPRETWALIHYAKALQLCHEQEKAEKMKKRAIKWAAPKREHVYLSLHVAEVLASFDPESAITQLQKTDFEMSRVSYYAVILSCYSRHIFKILMDLNNKTMIIDYAEKADRLMKSLDNTSAYMNENLDKAYSGISVASAPHDLERAKIMVSAIKGSVCRARTLAKMAGRIFNSENL